MLTSLDGPIMTETGYPSSGFVRRSKGPPNRPKFGEYWLSVWPDGAKPKDGVLCAVRFGAPTGYKLMCCNKEGEPLVVIDECDTVAEAQRIIDGEIKMWAERCRRAILWHPAPKYPGYMIVPAFGEGVACPSVPPAETWKETLLFLAS